MDRTSERKRKGGNRRDSESNCADGAGRTTQRHQPERTSCLSVFVACLGLAMGMVRRLSVNGRRTGPVLCAPWRE